MEYRYTFTRLHNVTVHKPPALWDIASKGLEEHISLLILFMTVWGGPYSMYETPMSDFKIYETLKMFENWTVEHYKHWQGNKNQSLYIIHNAVYWQIFYKYI
jgi:hypothetical protein